MLHKIDCPAPPTMAIIFRQQLIDEFVACENKAEISTLVIDMKTDASPCVIKGAARIVAFHIRTEVLVNHAEWNLPRYLNLFGCEGKLTHRRPPFRDHPQRRLLDDTTVLIFISLMTNPKTISPSR